MYTTNKFTNLNADYLDGYNASAFELASKSRAREDKLQKQIDELKKMVLVLQNK